MAQTASAGGAVASQLVPDLSQIFKLYTRNIIEIETQTFEHKHKYKTNTYISGWNRSLHNFPFLIFISNYTNET